jgi:hypothetical protein
MPEYATGLPTGWAEGKLSDAEKLIELAKRKVAPDSKFTLADCYERGALITQAINAIWKVLKAFKLHFASDKFNFSKTVRKYFGAFLDAFARGAAEFANYIYDDSIYLLAYGQYSADAQPLAMEKIDTKTDTHSLNNNVITVSIRTNDPKYYSYLLMQSASGRVE